MWPNDRSGFLAELDATDEAYVRKKLALGGYTDSQVKVVEYWLQCRAAERAERRAAEQLVIAKGTAFWTNTRSIAAVLGVALTVLLHWLSTR